MTKPIVFLDIDGTILDYDKNIPNTSKKSIQQLKDKGIHVAIATGRAPFMFEHIRKELDIHSFVSFNGQYVVFEDEVVYQNPLPKAKIEQLYTQALQSGHPMVFLNDMGMRASEANHSHISESLGSLKFEYPEIDPEFYKNQNIHQALLFCTTHEEPQYLGGHDQLDFIRWHQYSMDVLPLGGSKAIGIEKFIERTGLKKEDTYAFGDGLNDKEMIQFANTGVAMGNAQPEVKELADVVTKNVEEDGLTHGFRMVGLLE
ncbi:Cof-type HAD-IIB family hydrolase [Pontibacillus yanchengensis]|uniref:Cof-type HAD-IIB family hydrolase n=2 Tax=Pontibacillus yanchengensis TaxID=462910 RepID=A0A6I4ZRV4_9BACI|nr:Cof-type HAD-IIB family hydrolase [Pontibacillus yanchengensis]MYL32968.1 Cof-type HAD-IIB family hydrolase [Pontibacillus yanchengensis]MYL52182.1 Cof-type HAD-IIB family hydrolase [Pontibacillus yanchengensis]